MRRWALAAALAVLAAVGIYRVFAPDEVRTAATGPPPAPPDRGPGVVGTLPWAPLFVGGRLRVYATARQVHADGPIDFRVQTTPYWSLRRWPERVAGVVAAGTAVVSRWSDGVLVAVDAVTGQERWRVEGLPPAEAGALPATWVPVGLHVAGDTVIVVGPGDARAYRSADGGLVWQAATPGCAGRSFTAAGGLLGLACGADTRLLDTADGERLATLQGAGVEPLGCGAAYSGCGAVRINDKAWLLGARTPVESPTLAAVGARLAGTTAVDTDGATIVGRDPRTGARRWAFPIAASVLATQPDRVHLLAADHMLVTLDAATGRELSRFRYVAEDGAVDWDPGRTYAAGGYLATERRHEPEYPYPVILAAT